jgi:hypothetical protein
MTRYVLILVAFLSLSFLGKGESYGYNNCSSPVVINAIKNKDLSNTSGSDVLECISENKNIEMLPLVRGALSKATYYPQEYIKVLGEIGAEEEKEFLLSYWNKLGEQIRELPEKKVRFFQLVEAKVYLIDALYKLGDVSHLEEVYPLAHHGDMGIRYYSTGVLGKVGDERAVTILRDMALNDPVGLPRCGAVSALVEMGDPEIYEILKDKVTRGKFIECEIYYFKQMLIGNIPKGKPKDGVDGPK